MPIPPSEAPRLPSPRSQPRRTPLPGVIVTLNDSANRFPRHWHETFGLGLIERGAQRSGSGRGVVDACAGQLITHNPGEVHDGAPIGHAARRWRMVETEPAALARLLGAPSASALEWHAPVMDDLVLRHLLQAALDNLGCTEVFEESLVLALGRALQAPRRPAAIDRADPPLALVRERLVDDLSHSPTLDELAALAGTSRYVLVRRFARRYHLPPMAWLQQVRLHRAREQIAAGQPLSLVAHACGFSDQSHLTRLFRRQFSYTPGQWQAVATGPRRATPF